MIILISQHIDFDPGVYTEWTHGMVEIYGQWDNWTEGQRLNLGVIDAKFYIFGEIDIPKGSFEYKYRFRCKNNSNDIDHWFNDNKLSNRHNNNQIINTTNYNDLSYLQALSEIPFKFDIINLITGEICTYNPHNWEWYILSKPSDPMYKRRETMCISLEIFKQLSTVLLNLENKCNHMFGGGCWHVSISHDFNINIFIHHITSESKYFEKSSTIPEHINNDGSACDAYFSKWCIGSYVIGDDYIFCFDNVQEFINTMNIIQKFINDTMMKLL
jgi:hypothetical protein